MNIRNCTSFIQPAALFICILAADVRTALNLIHFGPNSKLNGRRPLTEQYLLTQTNLVRIGLFKLKRVEIEINDQLRLFIPKNEMYKIDQY